MRDEQGFRTFAATHGPELRRQALLLTGSASEAAALARDALAATARRWDSLAPGAAEERARAALARTVVRRRRAVLGLSRPAPVPPAAPADDAGAAWRALGALRARRRAVLVLRYDEKLDDAAIAARIGSRPAEVAAEAEAGLGTLRRLLRVRGAPEDLVPAALAEVGADVPAGAADEGAAALARAAEDRRRRGITAGAAGVAAAALVAAVVVPLSTGSAAPEAAAPPAGSPGGLLDWPARGPLAGDGDLTRAAVAAWDAAVPAEQRPAETRVLYAGRPDGTPAVLLQGVTSGGLVWVAQLTRTGDAEPRLVRTETMGRVAPVFALGADRETVRLLAPPDTRLLARTPDAAADAPMRELTADADGLSEPLVPGGGAAVVVLRGTGGATAVAGSGRVTDDRISAISGAVEIGTARLRLGKAADVGPDWYDDGRAIGAALDGPVTVAALGPRLTRSVGGRPVRARSYETVATGDTYLSGVVRFGAARCVTGTKLGSVAEGDDVPVAVGRCAPADSAFGVLHVLAGRDVTEVRIQLNPGRRGQKTVRLTVDRDSAGVRGAGPGFTALVPLAAMPTGTAEIRAVDRAGRSIETVRLPAYRPPAT